MRRDPVVRRDSFAGDLINLLALRRVHRDRLEHMDALAELAIAAAEIDGHPAASRPDLVARAVDDLGDDAYIEEVLAWVRGALNAERR